MAKYPCPHRWRLVHFWATNLHPGMVSTYAQANYFRVGLGGAGIDVTERCEVCQEERTRSLEPGQMIVKGLGKPPSIEWDDDRATRSAPFRT